MARSYQVGCQPLILVMFLICVACMSLRRSNRSLNLLHVGTIRLGALEQMAVAIKGHADRGVAHDGLQSLRRPAKIFDEQGGCRMSKHVEIIARLAGVSREPAFDLNRR